MGRVPLIRLVAGAVLVAAALAVAGCNADTTASPDQEKAFRNPSTEIPPDAARKMQESRERGMAEAQKRMNEQGNK